MYQSSSTASFGSANSPTGIGSEEPALAFAGFRLEADGSLFRGETLLHLPPKELAALRMLLANAGQIVSPLQLKRALWGDVHVTADSVPKCLSSLRTRLLPDNCIQTVYKRGYRLLADVRPYLASSPIVLPRLAIAPFTSEVGVPKHLGAAVAEEAIARLCNASRPLASVLARDSVFALALRGLSAQQIGASLRADLVLAGTLRSFISHFRLRLEMIRVADGVQIWVEDLLVERDRIAGLESDLASRLDFRLKTRRFDSWQTGFEDARRTPSVSAGHNTAPLLKGQIARRPERRAPGQDRRLSLVDRRTRSRSGAPAPTSAQTHSLPLAWSADSLSISASADPSDANAHSPARREAYEVFLRGRHERQSMERHRQQDGLQLILRATEIDPSFIDAKVDLAHLSVTQAFYGYMPPTVAADMVRRAAESIPDFPNEAEAMLPAMAWVNLHVDRNLPPALWAMEHSNHLPHDRWVTRMRANIALSRHLFAEAIDLLRAAIEIDPFSSWLHSRLAWAMHLNGQAAASVEQIDQAMRLFPEYEGARFYGVMIAGFNGDTAQAVELADDLVQRQPYFDPASAVQAYALASAGRSAEARAILERLQWLGRERFVLKSFNPAAFVALGDLDAAISELRAANDDRCPWFFQALADPRLKPLHGLPEFEELRAILPGMETAARREAETQTDPPSQI
ncbi:MAG: winged helix-turn-helix domain-containing protein [Terracidiphilus sp.]|jgi:DNA-binding winged helix-turn-helix (wHTH) protein